MSMPAVNLTDEERGLLLKIARQALQAAVCQEILEPLNYSDFPVKFSKNAATFVTLTRRGALRGCIGSLEAHQPLADDVREHAIAAGLQDFRFPPVQPDELDQIEIEISRLTYPIPLEYRDSLDLLAKLNPGIDGVVLQDSWRRATFLPQVWEKIPDPAEFLTNLCYKMGVASDLWRRKKLEVLIYQVEEFHE